MIPLWVIRYVLPGFAAFIALVAAYSWAHGRGVDAERGKWRAREVAAQEAQRARETALQAQVDAAGAALSMSTAEIERLSKRATGNVRNIYAARPADNVACLDPGVLRAIAESDNAPDDTSTASTSPR